MDFLRKLFPKIRNKSATLNSTESNNIATMNTNKSADQSSLHNDINSNILENRDLLHSSGNNITSVYSSATSDSFDDITESNKTLHTLENVTPIRISLKSNNTNNEFKAIGIMDDIMPQEAGILTDVTCSTIDETLKNIIVDETVQNISHINKEPMLFEGYDDKLEDGVVPGDITVNTVVRALQNVIDVNTLEDLSKDSPEIVSLCNKLKPHNDITSNIDVSALGNILNDGTLQNAEINSKDNVIETVCNRVSNDSPIFDGVAQKCEYNASKALIDDNTLQNLREFEDTLINFDKTTYVAANSKEDVINLDEFYDMLNNLGPVDEEINSQNSVVRNKFERDSKSTIIKEADEIEDTSENLKCFKSNSNELEIISICSSTSNDDVVQSKTENILETISINSDSEDTHHSHSDGYHSSDFEFISEAEASMDGFIINFRPESYQNNDLPDSVNKNTTTGQHGDKTESQEMDGVASDPGEGFSKTNRPKSQYKDRSYRNNHKVPDGDDYLGLFQGIYNPYMPMCEIYFLENKSVRTSAMHIQYDGIGFDKQLAMRRYHPDSSEDEFGDEAKECAKKILSMYPGANKKRRRRY